MVAKTILPDWLPSGWKVQIKFRNDRKIKCYVHSKTSQKLYSKPAVLRQVRNESISDDKSKKELEVQSKRSSGKEDMQLVVANDCNQWREEKKTEDRKNLEDISEVAHRNSPEWLPSGWKVRTKVKHKRKIKCYVHPKTSQIFYSKPAVLRHLKNERKSDGKSQATEVHAKRSSGKKDVQLVVANVCYQWLPIGWAMEIRTRKSGPAKGNEYKCYIDPGSGSKFYSKPEVLRYLKSIEGKQGSPGGMDRRSTRLSSDNRSVDQLTEHKSIVELIVPKTSTHKNPTSGRIKVLVENSVDKDLPSGWIKELRKRVLGNQVVRMDPLYFHSASGLVFRSKWEVLRYLESGEISRHTYRRKGCPAGDEAAANQASPSLSVVSDKSTTCGSGEKHTCRGDLILVPEAGVRRITRSMKSNAASDGEYNLVQRFLLPEKTKNKQEVLPSRLLRSTMKSPTRDILSLPKEVSQEIQNGDGNQNAASLMKTEPPAVSSRGILKANPYAVAVQGYSDGKPQTSKRKMKDQKLPSVASRSSKRLAGIGAQVVFHSIPIERACRTTSRKSTKGISISSPELSPCTVQEKPVSPDLNTHFVPAVQEGMFRPLNLNEHPVLVTEEQKSNSDTSMQKVLYLVDLDEDRPPGFPKCWASEAQTLKAAQVNNVGHKQLPSGCPIVVGQPVASPAGKRDQIASCQAVQEEQPASLSSNTEQSAFDFSSPSRNTLLNSPMDPPPPFLGGGPDAVLESKAEQPNIDWSGLELQQASMGQAMEQPASDFSFPSPMWSDPCLEFAFKTLTGMIPLDDNLANEDYIQHQLHTSQQSKDFQSLRDVDAPRFCQNNETKLDSQRPEGVRLPNGNSSGPPKTIG